jgi:3-hydroxyisobutyrate dehydrogenase-like beta-hydroxyacid dehydrogenase
MTLGFIGLGQMGKPIVLNLLKSGERLVATGRDETAFAELEAKGAETVQELKAIAAAETIFFCLPDGDVVHDVLFGSGGIAAYLGAEHTIIDLSTISYLRAKEIASTLGSKGIGFLDAPISGMPHRAQDGTLTVMCGGDKAVFDKVKPLLDLIGNKVLYMGPSGSGQLMKLINQLLFDINCAAMAEVLPMAVKLGLDPDLVTEVVNSGTGRSNASEYFLPRILRDHFSDGYPLAAAYKDLVSAAEISAKHAIPLPVLAAATATYQTALAKGLGGKDKGAMICVFEDLLGVKVRSQGLK